MSLAHLSDEDRENAAAVVARCVKSRLFFVEHVLGVKKIEAWQREVLTALDRGETRISIRSGHGVGKTALCSWVILHFILFRDNVKVPVTAPSSKQLDDGLIPECIMWANQLPSFLRSEINITDKRIERSEDGENNFVSFRTARADSPEALAGIHADHVMAVVDEASGVPEAVYESAIGTMSTPGSIFILIGNPTRPKGFFYKTQTQKKGSRWWVRRVSCMDSSRVSAAFVKEIVDMWGVDSPQYRVRVLGEFPGSDKTSVIPLELVEAAVGREISVLPSAEKVWGIDPGRGGDPSGFCERHSRIVTDLIEWNETDTMRIVGYVKERWDSLSAAERPTYIFVDSIGLGGPIADRLRELLLPAIDVNVSEATAMKQKYVRLRAELWYTGREFFEARNCAILPDLALREQFVDELTEPEVRFASNGKNDVESKESMKARKVASPNLADAFMLTFAFGGAVSNGRGPGSTADWNSPLEVETGYLV